VFPKQSQLGQITRKYVFSYLLNLIDFSSCKQPNQKEQCHMNTKKSNAVLRFIHEGLSHKYHLVFVSRLLWTSVLYCSGFEVSSRWLLMFLENNFLG
jgi:hypothetical protein